MCRVPRRIAALRAWTNLDSEETHHPLGSTSTAFPFLSLSCLVLPQEGGFVTTLLSAALIPASLYCTVSYSHVECLVLIGHVDRSLPAKDASEYERDLSASVARINEQWICVATVLCLMDQFNGSIQLMNGTGVGTDPAHRAGTMVAPGHP